MRSGTIAFLIGVTMFQQLAQLPGTAESVLLSLLLFCLFILSRWRSLFLIPFFLCTGFGYALWYATFMMPEPLAREIEGKDIVVDGVIASLPERQGRRVRFEFVPDSIHLDGEAHGSPGRLRLNWYGDNLPHLKVGDRWLLTVRLKRAHGMSNPGGFDYERWLYQRGIRATGYIRQKGENRLLADELSSFPLQRLRQSLRETLHEKLRNEAAAGIIIALAIGDRSEISDRQWRLLTASGINHLMAISGLHIGIVAGLFFFLGGWLWRLRPSNLLWLPAPGVAAISAILGAALYAALAGFSIPTQRALIMVTVAMGAVTLKRSTQSGRVLALTLLLVLLFDPLAVLSPGFWLSFLAVATILYGMAGRLQHGRVLAQWGRVQLLVSLGLLPMLIIYFNQMAIAAPLANLIAVPWMSMVVVPLTLFSTLLLTLLPAPGGFLLVIAARLSEWLLTFIEHLLEILGPVSMESPPLWPLLPAFAGMLWMLAPRGLPARWLGGLMLLPLLLVSRQELPPGAFRMTLFDVGQGLAAAVETRKHLLIYDTGPRFSSGFDTGRAVVVPWMKSRGITSIDTLVVSHGDNDHIGGARSLIENFPVDLILTSVPEKMDWTSNESCHTGQSWQWDGVYFELLHPEKEQLTRNVVRGNNSSCVLMIKGKGGSVLIPGDIEASAEYQLLARKDGKLRTTVLVAPHHGSKTSSTRRFVEAVEPQWVLFPVGYRNRFGFPHQEVVKRYRDLNAKSVDNSSSGAITFLFNPQSPEPEVNTYRESARRYWHN